MYLHLFFAFSSLSPISLNLFYNLGEKIQYCINLHLIINLKSDKITNPKIILLFILIIIINKIIIYIFVYLIMLGILYLK